MLIIDLNFDFLNSLSFITDRFEPLCNKHIAFHKRNLENDFDDQMSLSW